MSTVQLPQDAPEFLFEYTDRTNDGWHASVFIAGSTERLGTLELFGSGASVLEPNTPAMRRAADLLRDYLWTVQFPTLRHMRAESFASHVVSVAQRPPPGDDRLRNDAERLADWARTGVGMDEGEAASIVQALVAVLGLRSAEDAAPGPRIVLLGATARVALRRGHDVTPLQVASLATVHAGARRRIDAVDGVVRHGDAIAYLAEYGVTP